MLLFLGYIGNLKCSATYLKTDKMHFNFSLQEKKSTTPPPNLRNARVSSSPTVGSETKSYSNSQMASQQDSPYGDTGLSFNLPGKLALLGKVSLQDCNFLNLL